ncbi:MAG: carboxypeptidase regulatory-like domain-containing protein [Vicinamibacterales bacterium]|nr:carboxypeptidase regulatory-like domain-containing protein [Vicinamibacterales bacterium]
MRIAAALVGMLALAGPATGQTPPVAPAPKPAQAAPAPATAPGGIPQVPATAKPAVPASPRAPAAVANAKTTIVIEVTNTRGLGIQDIRVELAGPVPRDATTDASGFVRFLGLRPGTYRARFSGEDVVTLEKEIVVTAGRTTETEATLTPAEPKPEPPPPPPPPPPPAPAPPVVGPAGTPQVVDLLARERLGKGQTRLETLLGCSGNTRSTLLQLAQDQPQRLYEGAEIVIYVITGEAGITVGAKEGILGPGGFVSIPRSTAFTLRRRGNKTFEALVVLAGEPCERAQ